jgi:8-oxo-dGTP diphosphatase
MPYKTIDGITSSLVPFYLKGDELFVLLGQRSSKAKAFPNAWCLVGGFLEPGSETLQQTASRELYEETGLVVPADQMKLVTIQSNPQRDPRGQIIDTVWSCHLATEMPAKAADDLQAVAWKPLTEALKMRLAFDHNDSLARFAAAEGRLPL